MKKFVDAELDVILFGANDVIATSTTDDNGLQEDGNDEENPE